MRIEECYENKNKISNRNVNEFETLEYCNGSDNKLVSNDIIYNNDEIKNMMNHLLSMHESL